MTIHTLTKFATGSTIIIVALVAILQLTVAVVYAGAQDCESCIENCGAGYEACYGGEGECLPECEWAYHGCLQSCSSQYSECGSSFETCL